MMKEYFDKEERKRFFEGPDGYVSITTICRAERAAELELRHFFAAIATKLDDNKTLNEEDRSKLSPMMHNIAKGVDPAEALGMARTQDKRTKLGRDHYLLRDYALRRAGGSTGYAALRTVGADWGVEPDTIRKIQKKVGYRQLKEKLGAEIAFLVHDTGLARKDILTMLAKEVAEKHRPLYGKSGSRLRLNYTATYQDAEGNSYTIA